MFKEVKGKRVLKNGQGMSTEKCKLKKKKKKRNQNEIPELKFQGSVN